MPSTTMQAVRKLTSVKVEEINSWVSFLFCSPSPFSRYSLKVGIKATEIAFSAKRRRKRLGIWKATEKQSAKSPVPKKEAFVISRTSPIMREAKVMSERIMPERTKDFCFFIVIKNI